MLIPIWNALIVTKRLIKIICFDGLLNIKPVLIVVGSYSSLSTKILPEVLQLLVPRIEDLIDSYFSNRLRTLPVRINHRKQNITITWNIYPTDRISLEDLFQILSKLIDENLDDINGEIICYTISDGTIRDRKVQEFQIHSGKSWEIYLYEPETFIDVRLLLESYLTESHNKWISIDIDIVTQSAWFEYQESNA